MKRKHDIMGCLLRPQVLTRHAELVNEIRRHALDMTADGAVSLTDLARRMLYTRGHLNRMVKDRLGITLGQLVTAIRLEHAIGLLLLSPQMPMHEAATRSGYDSASSFSRAFRRVTGKSPTEYLSTARHARASAHNAPKGTE